MPRQGRIQQRQTKQVPLMLSNANRNKTSRLVALGEFVVDWAEKTGHVGRCSVNELHTQDHTIAILANDSANWLELPGGDGLPSGEEKTLVLQWLEKKLVEPSS